MWPPALSVSPFTPTQSQHYQSATNQINVPAPTTHDNAGNQTNIGGWTYTYDAEGRMLSATIAPSNRTQYVYDGEGQRVMKLACASTAPCTAATAVAKTVYVYDAGGNLAAEYPDSLGTPPCTTCYVTVDQLGSTRVLTDGSGSVVRRYDFMPFGEEIPADGSVRTAGNGYQSGWDGFTTKFTGQMRDSETGLDYFHARYYSAVQGRFLSPDPANIGADILDPQTWNGYAYVANSPMAFVDPLGLQSLSVGGNCTVCHVGNVPSFHSATPPPPPPAPSFSTVGGVTYSSPVTLGLRYTGYTTEVSLGNRIIYSPGAEVDYATDLMMVAPFRALLGARGAAAAAAAGAAEGLAERSVWNTLAPTLRGRVIETMLGGNLPRTFPVIDKFFNGLATSIKSMDLRLATYLNPAKLESALMGHVDKLAGFSGGQLGTTVVRNVTSRALEVAVPNGAMNAAQRAVFTKVAAQAAEKGIKVIVIPIR
jgi:RHS repeat-associated protein